MLWESAILCLAFARDDVGFVLTLACSSNPFSSPAPDPSSLADPPFSIPSTLSPLRSLNLVSPHMSYFLLYNASLLQC